MKSRHIKKNIISYVLSFIMMISIISISLVSLGTYSMFSVHGVMHTCDKIEYYDHLKNELMQCAYDLAIPYGLDKVLKTENKEKTEEKQDTESTKDKETESVIFLSDVFSTKQIKTDIRAITKAQIDNKKYQISVIELENKVENQIRDAYGTLSVEQEKSMRAYTEQVGKLYQKKIVIPGSEHIAKIIRLFHKLIWFVIPACLLIIVLCTFFLVSMRSTIHRGLRYVAYGFLGAAIVLITVFAGMISDGFIYEFNISSAFMRRFFTYFMGHEMLMQVFSGIGLLIAGIVIEVVVARMKFKGKV